MVIDAFEIINIYQRQTGHKLAFSATPELLARLDQLPEATGRSGVDPAAAAARVDGPFRFLSFIRPWRRWLVFGFGLVAVDSVLTLLGPWFIRRVASRAAPASPSSHPARHPWSANRA